MREFDTQTLKLITAFENITNSEVRDCIAGEKILYFVVNPGKAGLAIGKNGRTIKIAEKMLGKQIKIFEYSEDNKKFIKNLVPQAKEIEINQEKACLVVASKDRGAVIGKNGSNIKILSQILERNSNLKKLEIKS